jgi:hypothetical protein
LHQDGLAAEVNRFAISAWGDIDRVASLGQINGMLHRQDVLRNPDDLCCG